MGTKETNAFLVKLQEMNTAKKIEFLMTGKFTLEEQKVVQKHPDSYLRKALALNPNKAQEILSALNNDENPEVRLASRTPSIFRNNMHLPELRKNV